eukprot:Nk52_evm1s898 gene=Nk52_evmTU1s898
MPVSKWLPAQSAFVPEYIRWPDTKDLHDNYFYLTTMSADSKGRHVSDLFPVHHFRCGNVVADGVNNGEFLRVSWTGTLPSGVIFSLVPLSHGTMLSYGILCNYHENAKPANSSVGSFVSKSASGFQVTFIKISVDKFTCEEWKNPFVDTERITPGIQGVNIGPVKYEMFDGKINSVILQQTLSSGYSAPLSLSDKPADKLEDLHWGRVSFPERVKMAPEAENNGGRLNVDFQGTIRHGKKCFLNKCSPPKEFSWHIKFSPKFDLPKFTELSAEYQSFQFQVSGERLSPAGRCLTEFRFHARVHCTSNQYFVKDLFGTLSPGCVEYEFIPAPTSPSVDPEPTTSAVTTTVTPTKEPEPTASVVTTTVTPTKEPEPTASVVTTTVMTTKEPTPTTSAVTTTVATTKEPKPTTSAVTTTVRPTKSKKHYIQFCDDKQSVLTKNWVTFATDESFAQYLNTGYHFIKTVMPLPDLEQHKTFSMRTRWWDGVHNRENNFGVNFRSGKCGNLHFAPSNRTLSAVTPPHKYLNFAVKGPIPDGIVITLIPVNTQRKSDLFFIDYACGSDVTCPLPIRIRPELSYLKIRDSELLSDHWLHVVPNLSQRNFNGLPITDTYVAEYVRCPDRKDLNDNVFYFATRSGASVSDRFNNIRNFQCGNVIAEGVQNDEFLKVSWDGTLPHGVIFELVPVSYGEGLSYDIVCSLNPEQTPSAVTTTVTPTKEPETTPSAVTTTVMTTKEPTPTTSAVTSLRFI